MSQEVPAADPPKMSSIPVSVLLVDDRMANLTALEAVLDPLKINLVKATSGEEALWKILGQEFALVLLDVQMPGLDGFRVASLLRDRPSTRALPIIFLTALSREPENIFRGYEQGAVDYLVKPFDPNVLRSKVSVFVELYRKTKLIELQGELLRKKEREELQLQNERRFRRLTEAMPVAIWTMSVSGQCDYMNRRASACFPTGTIGLSGFLDAIHPDDCPRVEFAWECARSALEPFQLECRLRDPSSVWRWCTLQAVPSRSETGAADGWIVSAADIDRSKRAEETLIEKERQLQLANEAKDAFLAAASHELRSPLTAAKLMVRKASRGGMKDFAPLARQVDRMARLIDDLFDISRLQNGRLELELQALDLADLARELHERVDGSSDKHTFRFEVPSGLAVCADRGRIDQVLTNLIANAVRYSPEGGEIIVGAAENGDEVRLYVKDHGIGIPPEKQRLIFERFGQAHGARYGGLGLGLTIAEGIVLQHGGRIWVESEGIPGRGSTFHVRLPRAPPHEYRVSPIRQPAQAQVVERPALEIVRS